MGNSLWYSFICSPGLSFCSDFIYVHVWLPEPGSNTQSLEAASEMLHRYLVRLGQMWGLSVSTLHVAGEDTVKLRLLRGNTSIMSLKWTFMDSSPMCVVGSTERVIVEVFPAMGKQPSSGAQWTLIAKT